LWSSLAGFTTAQAVPHVSRRVPGIAAPEALRARAGAGLTGIRWRPQPPGQPAGAPEVDDVQRHPAAPSVCGQGPDGGDDRDRERGREEQCRQRDINRAVQVR